ncbi:MAG: hypothetical protein NW201_14890 [Gemmatimonadales bacterium]|nr:hypothetical protein [Gemmatimonadales bacterium]
MSARGSIAALIVSAASVMLAACYDDLNQQRANVSGEYRAVRFSIDGRDVVAEGGAFTLIRRLDTVVVALRVPGPLMTDGVALDTIVNSRLGGTGISFLGTVLRIGILPHPRVPAYGLLIWAEDDGRRVLGAERIDGRLVEVDMRRTGP